MCTPADLSASVCMLCGVWRSTRMVTPMCPDCIRASTRKFTTAVCIAPHVLRKASLSAELDMGAHLRCWLNAKRRQYPQIVSK